MASSSDKQKLATGGYCENIALGIKGWKLQLGGCNGLQESAVSDVAAFDRQPDLDARCGRPVYGLHKVCGCRYWIVGYVKTLTWRLFEWNGEWLILSYCDVAHQAYYEMRKRGGYNLITNNCHLFVQLLTMLMINLDMQYIHYEAYMSQLVKQMMFQHMPQFA